MRTSFASATITFLVYKEYASLLEGFPGVQTVVTLDRASYRSLNPIKICAETVSLLGHMRRSRFQLVVDFQGFGETGWLSWLTGAPQRWGSVYRPSRRWPYTHPVERNAQLHPIEYHLDVLRQAGRLASDRIHNEFVLPQKYLEQGGRFFAEHKLQLNRATLFIQPFTSDARKTWPLEKFIATAQHWRERGLQVVFGGGPMDRAALEPVTQAGFAVAAGASPLLSASLVKLSTLVLGGDTGLLHLARAMNKRVIMLIYAIHPGSCIPFGHPDWTITAMTGLPVASISVDAVNRACAQALTEVGL